MNVVLISTICAISCGPVCDLRSVEGKIVCSQSLQLKRMKFDVDGVIKTAEPDSVLILFDMNLVNNWILQN